MWFEKNVQVFRSTSSSFKSSVSKGNSRTCTLKSCVNLFYKGIVNKPEVVFTGHIKRKIGVPHQVWFCHWVTTYCPWSIDKHFSNRHRGSITLVIYFRRSCLVLSKKVSKVSSYQVMHFFKCLKGWLILWTCSFATFFVAFLRYSEVILPKTYKRRI